MLDRQCLSPYQQLLQSLKGLSSLLHYGVEQAGCEPHSGNTMLLYGFGELIDPGDSLVQYQEPTTRQQGSPYLERTCVECNCRALEYDLLLSQLRIVDSFY